MDTESHPRKLESFGDTAVRTSNLVLRTNLHPSNYINATHKLISVRKNRMRLIIG